MITSKTFLKKFSLYTIAGIFPSVLAFLLIPVLTKYLSTDDYGKIRLFSNYIALLAPILSLNATSILTIEYYKVDATKFRNIFMTSITIPFIGLGLVYLIVFSISDILSTITLLPKSILYLIPLITLLSVLYDTYLNLLVIQKKAGGYALVNIFKAIIETAFILLLIIAFHQGWIGRINALLISLALFALISIRFYKRNGWLKGVYSFSLTKNILIYSLPLVVHQLGKFTINQSDAIFISNMVSVSDAGIYSVGYQLGSIVMIVSGFFLNIYTPYLFERLQNITEEGKLEIVRISYLFVAGLIVLMFILTASSGIIFNYYVDAKYAGGVKYVFWTSLAYVFWGGYLMVTNYIFYFKKTYLLSIIAILNVISNLLFNYFFIRSYGTIGASYATTLSFLFTFLITAVMANKIFPMPWFKFKSLFFSK